MKRVLILSIIICGTYNLIAQFSIIAGATEGEYIHYYDPEPDIQFTYSQPTNIDLDNNGTNDLRFEYVDMGWPFPAYRYDRKVTALDSSVQISVDNNTYFAKCYNEGDTINNHGVWLETARLLSSTFWPPNTYTNEGCFGEKMLGVRINKDYDTIYGWMYIGGQEPCCMTLNDYAINDITIGKQEIVEENKFIISPNPFYQKLIIRSSSQYIHPSVEIYNSKGIRCISKDLLDQEVNWINTSNLIQGIYFLRVISENQVVYTKKIVKANY